MRGFRCRYFSSSVLRPERISVEAGCHVVNSHELELVPGLGTNLVGAHLEHSTTVSRKKPLAFTYVRSAVRWSLSSLVTPRCPMVALSSFPPNPLYFLLHSTALHFVRLLDHHSTLVRCFSSLGLHVGTSHNLFVIILITFVSDYVHFYVLLCAHLTLQCAQSYIYLFFRHLGFICFLFIISQPAR